MSNLTRKTLQNKRDHLLKRCVDILTQHDNMLKVVDAMLNRVEVRFPGIFDNISLTETETPQRPTPEDNHAPDQKPNP